MPIDVDWGNVDETILICKFKSAWTVEDARDTLSDCVQRIQSKSHTVTLLVDMRLSVARADNLFELARSALKQLPCPHIAILQKVGFCEEIHRYVKKDHAADYPTVHFVDTVDDAYTLIERVQDDTANSLDKSPDAI